MSCPKHPRYLVFQQANYPYCLAFFYPATKSLHPRHALFFKVTCISQRDRKVCPCAWSMMGESAVIGGYLSSLPPRPLCGALRAVDRLGSPLRDRDKASPHARAPCRTRCNTPGQRQLCTTYTGPCSPCKRTQRPKGLTSPRRPSSWITSTSRVIAARAPFSDGTIYKLCARLATGASQCIRRVTQPACTQLRLQCAPRHRGRLLSPFALVHHSKATLTMPLAV
jgi:hypothetical protein